MELNKEITLTPSPCDVSGVSKNHRILYLKEEGKIIVKSSVMLAIRDASEKHDGKAEILTVSQAVRRYPEVFTDSSKKKKFDGDIRTVILKVPAEMHTFLCRQGNITHYLRSLIEKEMKKV